jgi:hypothetical protein
MRRASEIIGRFNGGNQISSSSLNDQKGGENHAHFAPIGRPCRSDRGAKKKARMNSDMGAKATLKSKFGAEEMSDQSELAGVLIPEGKYRARFQGYKTFQAWGDLKLSLDFLIVDEGPFFGLIVKRYYSVRRVGKNGWKPRSATCTLLIEWFNCHPDSPRNIRRDRLPMTRWCESEYEIMVGTVRKSFLQERLPEQMLYSKVIKILGRA